jgi:acyl-CoA thioesterase FadM
MHIRYFEPARFFDLLRIFVEVIKLGNSSLHLRFRIINDKTKKEILEATQVHVQIDPKTQKSTPWSDRFREVVSRWVKNET